MSTCELYINLSNNNVFDKNLRPVGSAINIVFLDRVDIVNPIIRLAYTPDRAKVNYIYLGEFNRYYFAEKEIENDYIIFKLHCDVIYTFADQIKLCNATAERTAQKTNYNRYLNDQEFIALQNTRITIKDFPSGFNKEANNQSYVMIVGC